MNPHEEPPRWREGAEPALAEGCIDELRAYAQRGPSPDQRASVLAKTLAGVGASSPTGGAAKQLLWWGASGALLALCSALLFWPTARPAAHVTVPPSTTLPPHAQPELALPEPGPPPTTAPEVAPANKARRPPSLRRTPKVGEAPLAAQVSDPPAELRLLTPARQLVAIRPDRTLALANEHETSFPRGTFVQEREMLRIEALTRLGERARARAYARAFRAQYPHSAHSQRLDALLQAP